MRLLFFLLSLTPITASASPRISWGYETDKTKIARVQRLYETRLFELRDQYIADRQVPRSDLHEAMKTLYKICDLNSANYNFPDHKVRPISARVLPFWREATALLVRGEFYFACKERLFYALQPAPWSEELWESMRLAIKKAELHSDSYSVPAWAFVLQTLALRPRSVELPPDIANEVRKFAAWHLEDRRLLRERPDWHWGDIEGLLETLAEQSEAANKRMDSQTYAGPKHAFFMDSVSIDTVSGNRGLALALEAIRPEAVTVKRSDVAMKILYPEDLKAISENRIPACESYFEFNILAAQ